MVMMIWSKQLVSLVGHPKMFLKLLKKTLKQTIPRERDEGQDSLLEYYKLNKSKLSKIQT